MRKRLFILSPHRDDAALSCADHILEWKRQYEVCVINIFTRLESEKPPAYTLNVIKKIGQSEQSYSHTREVEDGNALQKLGVISQDLHLVDGGFRSDAGKALYPSPLHLFSNWINPRDKKIITILNKKWQEIFKPTDIIVSPLAVGRHTDHLLTKLSIQGLSKKLTYWEYLDYPYGLQVSNYTLKNILSLLSHRKSFKSMSEHKIEVLSQYKTQIPLFFPKGIQPYPEVILN